MMQMLLSELFEACAGEVFADDDAGRHEVTGLTWDSRTVTQGSVFLAMPGERVDGNDFIVKAIQAGAGAVICTRAPSDSLKAIAGEFACPLIFVKDGQEALSAIADVWRGKLHAIVVGVTGSTGKTSTKDFLRSVLSHRFKTHATQGNHNNELGVPATLLEADLDVEALIVELGMRGLGQIEQLAKFVRPSIGVITNIGESHLELLGTRENIARAKSELFAALPQSGLAVVNADDEFMAQVLEFGGIEERGIAHISYGVSPEAEIRAEDITFDEQARASFQLICAPDAQAQVVLSMPGKHNVSNALAAAAVGHYLGIGIDDIAAGLAEASGSGMRMEVVEAANGITFINDAYNASPDSMRSSLSTLASMDCTGRRIAVLGDMGELGSDEYQLHVEVGAAAAEAGLDLLVCVGTLANGIMSGAKAADMDVAKIVAFPGVPEASRFLKRELKEGDLVLVKASRFMGFEQIIEELVD